MYTMAPFFCMMTHIVHLPSTKKTKLANLMFNIISSAVKVSTF